MRSLPVVVLFLTCCFFIGCNDSNDSGETIQPPPGKGSSGNGSITLRLSGSWRGSASVLGDLDSGGVSITAFVQQSGDAITIRTSLSTLGANLSGSIDSDNCIRLTDAYDGEVWTTHFQKATDNHIQIADFLRPPSAEEPDPPTSVIDLRR